MKDTYKGDSIGKKLARAWYWERVMMWHGDRFQDEKHLVLASREGGDIRVLRALGVPDTNIIAVERCSEAARACEEATGLRVRVGDVADVAQRIDGRIGSALLDFCGIASEGMASTIATVALKVRHHGCLGYVYQRGREQPETRAKQVEALARNARQVPEAVRRRAEALACAPGARLAERDGRSVLLYDLAQRRISGAGVALLTLGSCDYSSSDVWQHGVPMTIQAKWVYRTLAKRPALVADKMIPEVSRVSKEWWSRMASVQEQMHDGIAGASEWEGHAFDAQNHCAFDGAWATPQALVIAAKSIAEKHSDAAGILNMSAAELAALKAHVSRGTYDVKITARAKKEIDEGAFIAEKMTIHGIDPADIMQTIDFGDGAMLVIAKQRAVAP